MDAMQILVVILSAFLAIFLVLGIVLAVQLIKITRQIKTITATTQSAVERVSSLASSAGKFVSPAIVAKFLATQVKRFTSNNKKEDK